MKLSDLPDIDFVNMDKENVEAEIFELYTSCTGRTLAKGDPIRLFVLAIVHIVILLLNNINYTGKQNLVKYAEGSNLDHLGILVGVERLKATAANTTIEVTLSETRKVNTLIPKGTRVTAGDNIYFATDDNLIIKVGETKAEVMATCTITGEKGNGYNIGEINQIVDPIPYVKSMINKTISVNGAEIENDNSFREAIIEAPEGFSVAGPEGAYQYHVKRVSDLIIDVAVISPIPGEVDIIPLLINGEIPQQEMLTLIDDTVNDKKIRPLTDKVVVKAPTVVNYDIELKYYISKDNESMATSIQEKIEEAIDSFILWQKSKLGRDINPSELISRIIMAGAKRVEITSPVYTKIEPTQVAILESNNSSLGEIEDE